MELQWHVVHVLSRNEKKVFERLDKQGITVYLPIQKQLRQWSDRKKWVEMVVVPGYIFVKITPDDRFQVLQIPGVSCFLKHCNTPVCIPESEMQRFRSFVETAEDCPIEFTTEKLPVGTFITIHNGPFKGFSGKVIQYKGKRKLTVKLSNFGHFLIDFSPTSVFPQK